MTKQEILNAIVNQDWHTMIKAMNNYKDFDIICGKNQDNEFVTIGVFADKIITKTYQNNNWCRINAYHKDGTVEELYER